MMHIDEKRILAFLRCLATFGDEERGVSRPVLSAADMAGRHWLAEEMAGAGLEPPLDAVGMIYRIEVARAWRQAYPDAEMGIDVIAFSDEERRFFKLPEKAAIL